MEMTAAGDEKASDLTFRIEQEGPHPCTVTVHPIISIYITQVARMMSLFFAFSTECFLKEVCPLDEGSILFA